MMNRVIKLLLIVGFISIASLFVPRMYILAVATYQYFTTDIVCYGMDPTPPDNYGESFPLPIFEVSPFSVITDQGQMYLGDEYEVYGEGDWRGMATLLWSGREGATFTITFESNHPEEGYMRRNCRWFLPLGDYR